MYPLGLNPVLHDLFKPLLKKTYNEPKVTFDEALRMDPDDMRKRRFDYDACSWRSESTLPQEEKENQLEFDATSQQFKLDELSGLGVEKAREKVSIEGVGLFFTFFQQNSF
jgi:hypothetical protein